MRIIKVVYFSKIFLYWYCATWLLDWAHIHLNEIYQS